MSRRPKAGNGFYYVEDPEFAPHPGPPTRIRQPQIFRPSESADRRTVVFVFGASETPPCVIVEDVGG